MLNIEESNLKSLLESKRKMIERTKYDGAGEIVSGISITITLCLADFNTVKIMRPVYFQIIAWLVAISIIIIGVIRGIKSLLKFYPIESLYNAIRELDPNVEHAFNIILIKNSSSNGKYLLFKSKRWKCELFPNYHAVSKPYNRETEEERIKKSITEDIGFELAENIKIEYLGNRISIKYSVGDKIEKKYNFHFYRINHMEKLFNKCKRFSHNGKKYVWKTLDQMYSDKNIVKKNEDVLDYIREKCSIS